MSPLQILLVEDSESHAELVRRALVQTAAELVCVTSLAQARDWLASHTPGLILSDLQLPDGSAISLFEEKEELVRWPVVVMTGHGDETLAAACIKAGALEYVVKSPDSIRHLPRTIERALRDWRRIADHREMQRALELSEERLRLAMEATSDGLWDWDLSSEEIYWSPRCFLMLGYGVRSFPVTQASWRDLVHPEDQPQLDAGLGTHEGEQGAFSVEVRMRSEQGAWRWINCRGKPVAQTSSGRVLRMVGTLVDIHERVIAEQSLQESKQRFELLFERAKDAIVVADAETGCVLEVNTTAEKLLGRSRRDLCGLPVCELHPPEAREKCRLLFEDSLGGAASGVDSMELLAADGRHVPVEVAASSIVLPSGQTVVQGLFRDISERLHLEAQLRQAQKMEAIGQLAGGVAHDFNNVLAAIMLQISMLQADRRMPPEVRSTLTILESSAKRAADLTRQLLLFGRRQPAKMQALDMDLLVANLLKMLRRLIGESIHLDFVPVPNRHWIHADQGMIEQVLMNLVVNARDAMPEGGHLSLVVDSVTAVPPPGTTTRPVSEGAMVRVRVSDTGHGIDPAVRKKLFEPFFTTKPQGKGTGLGLATAFSILKTHQGWIEVESEPGKGTCFSFFLPSIEAPEGSSCTVEPQPAAAAPAATVLLVEDDQLVRTFTTLSLKTSGFDVIEAVDGHAALSAWTHQRSRISYVLSDMVMPSGLNGWDVITAIHSQAPGVPAVIMSGYVSDLPPEALDPARGVAFLQKPFDTPKLLQALREAESRKKA